MFGSSKLFSAFGPIVTEQSQYFAGGVGYYMANFLSSRMYSDYLTLRQCVILAAYILFQAKEHVDGCGGDSHIAVLRNHGVSGQVNWVTVERLNKILSYSDAELGGLLLASADLEVESGKFTDLVAQVANLIDDYRQSQMADYRQLTSVFQTETLVRHPDKNSIDEFGLPMPSSPEA